MGKDLKGREIGKGLSQRPDKRYEARAVVNGQKIDLYDLNLNNLVVRFEEAKRFAKTGIAKELTSLTLNEWFDEWFKRYKEPSLKFTSVYPTVSRYNTFFRDSIGNVKLSDLKNYQVQDAVNAAATSGKTRKTVSTAVGLLKESLESARNNGIVSSNPAFDVRLPWMSGQASGKERYLSMWELSLFLEVIEHNFYKEMFYVMLCTGLRVGEVGGLQWCDVDWVNKGITVRTSLNCQYYNGQKVMVLTEPKTVTSNRVIPFMGECEEMLKAWKVKQDVLKEKLGNRWRSQDEFSNLVFTTSLGSPVIRHLVEKELRKISMDINAQQTYNDGQQIEVINPHALRHTFCSICFEKGMTPKVVQRLMGHVNFNTTMNVYNHVLKERMEKDVESFGTSILNLKDFTQNKDE